MGRELGGLELFQFHFCLVGEGTLWWRNFDNLAVKDRRGYGHFLNNFIASGKFPEDFGGFGENIPSFFLLEQVAFAGEGFTGDSQVVHSHLEVERGMTNGFQNRHLCLIDLSELKVCL